ncbi:hypothetical protein A2960_05005 [Candidatus Gottesmanbacteria bacterium RIFCSPLOWO2_01_FULL_39_12b]|uniref:Uncharacterized protein n=1 Tax=Candidatus Gottesmanbacteria bacterium RIFCSPLOWO2_01_FULL_39_12b TaxID=1798388 RepID=A0A1F6ALX3_9BACT|nr:MAG: hypothetical protein A2960_05005 [Candidatus Gottesmanbacteria bacterium RIFCSPLOWO2_01_FULL_39_12b]
METLQNIWKAWKKVARKIATFQSKILLTIFYFTFILPFGITLTIFKDKLERKTKTKTGHSDNLKAQF